MPATAYDIAFLRVLMNRALAEKAQALRCVQLIDERAQRGQPTNARALVVELGLVDAAKADELDAQARDELQRAASAGAPAPTMTGVFRPGGATASGILAAPAGLPPPPPPLPGRSPATQSGFLPSPATQSGFLPNPATQSGTLPNPATQSGFLPRPAATQSGVLPPPARPPAGVTQSQLIAPAAATQSGILRAPPPRPAPVPGAPAPVPGPAPLPKLAPPPPASGPPPTPTPYKVGGAAAVADLAGELTIADGSMARVVAGKADAADEAYYDLAENGQGLEAYESGPKLGRGPVGLCYLGRKKLDRGPVVVKVISRRFDEHPPLLAEVLADVQAWIGFRHPGVAATLARGTSNGRNVVVFEQARGRTVAAHLAQDKRPLEPRHAMRAVYDVAQALAAAHDRGLAAGDIRATKVFWDGQHAQLTDLGLARASCLASGFGQYGLAFGHPAYLAPEVPQERLARPTKQTDVYALGILFYELLCGALPFQGEGVELLGKHLEAPLPPPPPSVTFSPAVAGLILRMTAKSPSQRLPDARAVVTAITQLLEGKPITFPTPAAARPKQPASGTAKAISTQDWGEASARVENKHVSDKWTVSKIEQAPPVGPSDLSDVGPAISELGPAMKASVTGRLPRELLADDPAPQVPGGPKVGEKLGRGPVGTSYEGALPGAPGPVVVKVLSKKFGKHPDLIKRILDGARAAQPVTHPGVVRVLRVLQAAGRDMVVFERVPGARTLREVLARGPLPPSEATARLLELARALEAARKAGLSHGDVRPEKVLIDEAGRARLADFGLAEAAALGAGFGGVGVPFGHPTYLAPEVVQERRKEPDERVDVYALGCLYYELLCGRAPFQGPDPKKTLRLHLEAVIPPPPDGVTVPAPVAELILRMTAKDPARRPPSMADLAARLQQVAAAVDAPEAAGGSDVGSLETGASAPFDPERSDEPSGDAQEVWGQQSLGFSRPSGEWDKNKIIAAPKVGPEEWTPDDSEDLLGDAGTSGSSLRAARPAAAAVAQVKAGSTAGGAAAAVAAAPPRDALMAAIEAAAATRESSPDGAAAPEGEPAPGPAAAKSASGRRKRPAAAKAGAPAAGGNQKQLVLAGAGVLAVLLVMLVLALRGGDEPAKVATNGGGDPATDDARPTPPPPSTEPDPAEAAAAARRKRAEAAAQAYEQQATELIRSQRFKEALQARDALPPEVRDEATVKPRLAAVEQTLTAAVDARLAKEVAALDQKLAAEDWDAAQADLRRIQQWAPTRELTDPVAAKIKAALDARDKPVRDEDTGERVDPASFKNDLEARCKGVANGLVYDNGGVIVTYPAADEVLLGDLEKVAGAAPTFDAGPPGAVVVKAAGDQPTVLVFKLPLKRLVDATVDLVVRRAGPGARVALLQGSRPGQPRGFGVLWGLVPVTAESVRAGLVVKQTLELPELAPDTPLRLRLRMSKRSDVQLDIAGSLRRDGKDLLAVKSGVEARRAEGAFTLWVEDAEVAITSLQVRGHVDPKAIR